MEIGLGTSTIRSLGRRLTINQIEALLTEAAASKIRYIDTANSYGAGSSERGIRSALDLNRVNVTLSNSFRIISKCGFRFVDLPQPFTFLNQPIKKLLQTIGPKQCFEPEFIISQLHGSRRRLGGLMLYAYCLHNPPLRVIEDGEAVGVLARAKAMGWIRKVGVSIDSGFALARIVADERVEFLELPADLFIDSLEVLRARSPEFPLEIAVNQARQAFADTGSAITKLSSLSFGPDVLFIGTRNALHLRQNAKTAQSE